MDETVGQQEGTDEELEQNVIGDRYIGDQCTVHCLVVCNQKTADEIEACDGRADGGASERQMNIQCSTQPNEQT